MLIFLDRPSYLYALWGFGVGRAVQGVRIGGASGGDVDGAAAHITGAEGLHNAAAADAYAFSALSGIGDGDASTGHFKGLVSLDSRRRRIVLIFIIEGSAPRHINY